MPLKPLRIRAYEMGKSMETNLSFVIKNSHSLFIVSKKAEGLSNLFQGNFEYYYR